MFYFNVPLIASLSQCYLSHYYVDIYCIIELAHRYSALQEEELPNRKTKFLLTGRLNLTGLLQIGIVSTSLILV